MPITFTCAECGETYEVGDDMAGRTIRCRECHGFNRVEAPYRKPASPPTVAALKDETPKPVNAHSRLRRPITPLLIAGTSHTLTVVVWSVCAFHTLSVMRGWQFSDLDAVTVHHQTVNGIYTLARLAAGWIVACAMHFILRACQRISDLCAG
jgi:hypothetical protein